MRLCSRGVGSVHNSCNVKHGIPSVGINLRPNGIYAFLGNLIYRPILPLEHSEKEKNDERGDSELL